MYTIKKLSSSGFQLKEDNRWYKCDKFKVLSKEPFLSLKINDQIDNIKLNNKDFVISFDVLSSPLCIEKGSDILGRDGGIPPSVNSVSLPSSVQDIKATDKQREILKGQCLNIAFKDKDVSETSFIQVGIVQARTLFRQLEDADYYNW